MPRHLGNKTECALLQFAGELGEDYEAIRKANTEESFFKVYTFNSKRKCMATVLKTETGFRIFVKGKLTGLEDYQLSYWLYPELTLACFCEISVFNVSRKSIHSNFE